MLNIVLFEPEIPPNTGNIIRLCTNVGARLHLIHPLGFNMNEKSLKRAGMDYINWSIVHHYENYQAYQDQYLKRNKNVLYAISTKGTQCYSECQFKPDDHFIFGPETRGLPKPLLNQFKRDKILRIPMQKNSRSLNLSNAVSVVLYEAWRQNNFCKT